MKIHPHLLLGAFQYCTSVNKSIVLVGFLMDESEAFGMKSVFNLLGGCDRIFIKKNFFLGLEEETLKRENGKKCFART